MKAARSSWLTTIFEVLLVAALPVHVWAYKILMVPLPGKSHVFSMAAIAEGLVNNGHNVTIFVGENFCLHANLPEFGNGTKISVVKFEDKINGANMDYEGTEENISQSAIESRGNVKQLASIINRLYVILLLYLY